MMNSLNLKILLIALFILKPIFSQEFSFTFRFEDASGNKDSIILGYDSSATDSIDPIFGEVNILSKPWNPGIDVRISNDRRGRRIGPKPQYQLKKQILQKRQLNGAIGTRDLTIEIHTNSWPVTVTWDSSPFQVDERIFSGLRNGYFDYFPNPKVFAYLSDTSSISFEKHIEMFAFGYVESGDTIPLYVFYFSDSNYIGLSGIKMRDQLSSNSRSKFTLHMGNSLIKKRFSLMGQHIGRRYGYGAYISQ